MEGCLLETPSSLEHDPLLASYGQVGLALHDVPLGQRIIFCSGLEPNRLIWIRRRSITGAVKLGPIRAWADWRTPAALASRKSRGGSRQVCSRLSPVLNVRFVISRIVHQLCQVLAQPRRARVRPTRMALSILFGSTLCRTRYDLIYSTGLFDYLRPRRGWPAQGRA